MHYVGTLHCREMHYIGAPTVVCHPWRPFAPRYGVDKSAQDTEPGSERDDVFKEVRGALKSFRESAQEC